MDSPTPQTESPYETQRRMENIVRKGTVAAVRLAAPARVRVKTGDHTTDWLPWIALRAGGVAGGRTWNPAVVGEQCTVLAPGGDLAQAVVLLGLYSDAMPQGSEQAACDRTDWDEDNYFEWLRGALTAYCMESITLSTPNTSVHMEDSSVTITGGGAVLTIGPNRITSNVRELEGALNRVVAHAQLIGRAITLETTQEVLHDLLRANDRRITIEAGQVA